MKPTQMMLLSLSCLWLGCSKALVDSTDRTVYSLIEQRQTASLGEAHDANLGYESGNPDRTSEMYSFNPHPIDDRVPDSFNVPAAKSDETPRPSPPPPDATTDPDAPVPEQTADIYTPDQRAMATVFNLKDALAYAMRHSREFQGAKEQLYLAALDLTLERHLWTPQFVTSVQSDYNDFSDDVDPERSLLTISDLAVSQRLPYGGDVTARVIHTLARQVSDEVSKGESGQAILSANLPLLRGAGPVAMESLYSAEREMIYAVRQFEDFRRDFVVLIAADYFALQELRAAIANTYKSYLNRRADYERAEFIDRMGRSRTIFDAPRAKANLRIAEAGLVNAKERYATALDLFKIRLAMSVDAIIDVVEQNADEYSRAVDVLLPAVDEVAAIDVALKYRLDLLNSIDATDDARRGVLVAKNRILPDLNLTGSATFDSDPNQLRPANFREERATWHGGVSLRMNDRMAERTAYRAALINLRAAQREQDQTADTVRAEVRRARRRIAQQENLKEIQRANVQENALRVEAAREQFKLGKIENRDVVEAENNLLVAENDLARAIAEYRIAILEFRRDTGTLRVTDEGEWQTDQPLAAPPTAPPPRHDG